MRSSSRFFTSSLMTISCKIDNTTFRTYLRWYPRDQKPLQHRLFSKSLHGGTEVKWLSPPNRFAVWSDWRMTTRASCSTVIGFESGISDLVAFETKTRSIRLPPKASADTGFQRLGTYVHKSHSMNRKWKLWHSYHQFHLYQLYLPFCLCWLKNLF